ncbi:MAG TPA: DMT family transporter [Thermoanaerobaculia bacterium]|nr:DMT family transporter [Thermoanaerobaculia bacterium]
MRLSPAVAARAALLFAAVVWGATFVVVERALHDLPVFHLLAYRFALGGLLLAPLLRRVAPGGGRALAADGLRIGLLLFAGFAFQTAGLLYTTPARSAFVTGLSVLLVPAIGWALGTWRPRALPVLGAACAAAGLWALFRPAPGTATFNLGDALTLGCALAFAGHVLAVDRAIRRHRVGPLAVVQFAVVAALSAPFLLLDPPVRSQLTTTAVVAVLVTGVLSTAVGFACQLYAQRRLGAAETAVLLTFEPVVAAIASIGIGREAAGPGLLLGGALIVAGMLLTDIGSPPPQPPGAAAPRA